MAFSSEIKQSLFRALKDLDIPVVGEEIVLEHPAEMGNGDYSTNIAMFVSAKCKVQSAKLQFKVQSFRDTAELIVKRWQKIGPPEFIEKIEVAGAGFINIWLKIEALGRQLEEVLKEGENYGRALKCTKTMVIDYSSPNIAKPFGIGHLRSTNIGQAIYNLYKFLGWEVIGDNHLGDWGTQFGKLIFQIVRKIKKGSRESGSSSNASLTILYHSLIKQLTINELERMYVEFHKEAEKKPEMEEEARKWFKRLEEGDPEAKAIWQACVDISLKEFNRIYKLLGVKINYAYGESFYQDKMDEILADCRKKGILKESQGALVVELTGMGIPAMLVKSDGATTYLLRDLATVKFRKKTWNPDLIVYEVGADQTFHFTQLFKICVLLGYGELNQFVHVAHGLIRWPTGKFSTRKGDTIHLENVLTEAIEKAKALYLASKTNNEIKTNSLAIASEFVRGEDWNKERKTARKKDIDDIAKAVGIGAIKYNDLKQNPKTDIIFDWEQILTFSGNSGPYLQYTYARTQSVLANAKCKITIPAFAKASAGRQWNNEEIILLRTLYRFPEIVEESAKQFSPNILCNFLFGLAQKFSLFYDKHRILAQNAKRKTQNHNLKLKADNGDEVTEEQSQFRLGLTEAVGQVLKNGLTILGIEALERM